MEIPFLQSAEFLRELNILIERFPGWPLGAVAAIAFFCRHTSKVLGGEAAFYFELIYQEIPVEIKDFCLFIKQFSCETSFYTNSFYIDTCHVHV